MSRSLFLGIYLALCLFLPASLKAELYQWTDKNGKVHYSDRKPATQSEVREIGKELTPVNIDSSNTQRQALGKVFPKADKNRQRLDNEKKQRRQSSRNKACTEAREYLRKINRRVRFIDENGNPVKVSEAERKKRVIKVQADIKKHCD